MESTRKTINLSCLSALLVMFVLLFIPAHVYAMDETMPDVKYQKTLGISNEDNVLLTSVKMGAKIKNAKKVTVTSSNKKVVTAKVALDNNISLFAQKPGKSNVKVKVKYKSGKTSTYPISVTVYNYINPVKSFKIGSKSFSFKKKSSIDWTPNYSASKVTAKIAITAKSGWKLKNIYTKNDKKVKNKSKITLDGTKGTYYLAEMYNTKKKLTEVIALGLDNWIDEEDEE